MVEIECSFILNQKIKTSRISRRRYQGRSRKREKIPFSKNKKKKEKEEKNEMREKRKEEKIAKLKNFAKK
ncbi:MAG: hypothetical protein KAR24_01320 [Candidatus Pacebacteria bacterium]|nr:hypothetical protein [Candidatus Paceibacterota bacterium]